MKKGDILELDIIDSGINAEGVAKTEGIVVFIPFTLIGERVKVEVVFVGKAFARAKVIKLLKASENRTNPECKFFRKCGGCDYLHISYPHQLQMKKDEIANCLKKTAKITLEVSDTVAAEENFHYRNKIQLPIGLHDGKVRTGFFKEGSHDFIAVENCLLQGEWADGFIKAFEKYANDNSVTVYDEKTGKGALRHLILRKIGECVSVTVVGNCDQLPAQNRLILELEAVGEKFSLHFSRNKIATNVIMGDKLNLIYGKQTTECNILGVKVEVSPNSFMQINNEIRDKVYIKVKTILSKHVNPIVIDAFSGVGVLSNLVAKTSKKVYAVEIAGEAVENAKTLARLNGNAEKIENILGDCALVLPKLAESLKGQNSLVVLDPPRKGCDKAVLQGVLEAKPSQIVYISCNPSTLARDVSILAEEYIVREITPYDMFPNTCSVETLLVLDRKNE